VSKEEFKKITIAIKIIKINLMINLKMMKINLEVLSVKFPKELIPKLLSNCNKGSKCNIKYKERMKVELPL
jgi:hypothetical protein